MYPYSAKSNSVSRKDYVPKKMENTFQKSVNHFAFFSMFSYNIEMRNPKRDRQRKINGEKIMTNFPQHLANFP